jgi:hypothetical protein
MPNAESIPRHQAFGIRHQAFGIRHSQFAIRRLRLLVDSGVA